MYARGMTVREIRGHLQELYGIEVSPDLISTVTDAVLEAVETNRRTGELDACYAIVSSSHPGQDPRRGVRSQQGGGPSILPDGTKEILGLWIEQTEGVYKPPNPWLRVMAMSVKNRGVQDILLAVASQGLPSRRSTPPFPETGRFRPVSST